MTAPGIRLVSSPRGIAREAALLFPRRARRRVSIALCGGSTPRPLYELLAREPWRSRIPWVRLHFFWGDERCVPPDDPRSNYRMAAETLLSKVPVPAANVHRVPGELPPARAAEAYRRSLREAFGPGLPRFDLVLLGLGADGHTASLFPGSRALLESRRSAVSVRRQAGWRVTLTVPVLSNAKRVVFLVSGADKAAALAAALGPSTPPGSSPARLVRGRVLWLADRAAARLLPLSRTSRRKML